MKKNIAKNYVSKIIATVFCLVMLVYGQCGHAIITLTQYQETEDGGIYTKLAVEDEASMVTPEIILEIETILNTPPNAVPIGFLDLGTLKFMPGTFSALVEILRDKKLKMLALDGCTIESSELQLVSELIRDNNIVVLNVYNTGLNRINIRNIAEVMRTNTRLNIINLGGNDFGREGAVEIIDALHTNISLSVLALSNSNIGDEGILDIAPYLRTNSVIADLVLSRNKIGNKGATNLAESLLKNKKLISLDLEGNIIGDEGVQAIADALRVNPVLEKLNLLRNPIGKEGTELLLKAIVDNISLLSIEVDWTNTEQREIIGCVLERNKLIKQLSGKIRKLTHDASLSLLLGTHPRVGVDSPLAMLNGYILREILTNYRENVLEIIMNATELQLQVFAKEEYGTIIKIRGLQKHITDLMGIFTVEERQYRSMVLPEYIVDDRQHQAPTTVMEEGLARVLKTKYICYLL